ncbi:DsbA family protein [Streptomyces sp. NPDC020747]|uniref:DsbA family protein n=1 Tax=Streptomyces sp. NPDC020747 TaxID=3365086 RepID=UPI0037B49972
MPSASGLGPVMAAARNCLYSLNDELADTGVYAGTLSVAALIARSAAAEAQSGAPVGSEPIVMNGFELPVVDPDDLAEHHWDMYTERDRVERIHPEPLSALRVDIWSDVVCPWWYIGKRRLETAVDRFEHADAVEIHWHSFRLDPSHPKGHRRPVFETLVQKAGPRSRRCGR